MLIKMLESALKDKILNQFPKASMLDFYCPFEVEAERLFNPESHVSANNYNWEQLAKDIKFKVKNDVYLRDRFFVSDSISFHMLFGIVKKDIFNSSNNNDAFWKYMSRTLPGRKAYFFSFNNSIYFFVNDIVDSSKHMTWTSNIETYGDTDKVRTHYYSCCSILLPITMRSGNDPVFIKWVNL